MKKIFKGTKKDVQIAEQITKRVQKELDNCLMCHRYEIKDALLADNYLYINIKTGLEMIDKYDLELINKINKWEEKTDWVIKTNLKHEMIIELTIYGWKIK